MCGDSKLLVDPLKSHPNTGKCPLEEAKFMDVANGNLIYHQIEIVIHLDLIKWTIQFFAKILGLQGHV